MFKKLNNVAKTFTQNPKAFVDAIVNGSDKLPFDVRQTLNKIKDQQITSLQIIRAPISSVIMKLLNVTSGMTLEDKIKKSPYDTLVHLNLRINNTWDLEKEDRIVLHKKVNRKDQEVMNIVLPNGFQLTIGDFVKSMMDKYDINKIVSYNASSNNCQVFILMLLEANDLLTDDYRNFIKQDTSFMFKNNSNYRKLLNSVTTIGNRVNTVLTQGLGIENNKSHGKYMNHPHPWINHIKMTQRKHGNISYKEAMKIAKHTYTRAKRGGELTGDSGYMGDPTAYAEEDAGTSYPTGDYTTGSMDTMYYEPSSDDAALQTPQQAKGRRRKASTGAIMKRKMNNTFGKIRNLF